MSEFEWGPIPSLEMLAQLTQFNKQWPSGGVSIDGSELEPGGARFDISLLKEPDADEILKAFPAIDCTAELTIMNSPASGAGLHAFFAVPRPGLKGIRLFNTRLTGRDIAGLPPIQGLIQFSTDISSSVPEMLSSLSRHSKLTEILLNNIGSKGAALSSLADCEHLSLLNLSQEQVNVASLDNLAFLADCNELTSLELSFPSVKEQCFEDIACAPHLKKLTILNREIHVRCIAKLASTPVINRIHCYCDRLFVQELDSPVMISTLLLWASRIEGDIDRLVRRLVDVESLELASPDMDPLAVVRGLPQTVKQLVLRTNQEVTKAFVDQLASCQPLRMLQIDAPRADRIERQLKALMPNCDVRISLNGFRGQTSFAES